MRPLVLGAGGQLGSELTRLLGRECAVTRDQVSITDQKAVADLISSRRPAVVFNCAAYNAVDRAENEPAAAMMVNRDGVANVAAACARHGAKLVHFSTNFVFDGAQDRAYVESDAPRPLGAYGLSKLAGERAALDADPRALVIRTAAVYGRVGAGFPERILERARTRGELEVVADQSVNPTSAADLAARTVELAGQELSGLVHLAGEGCCTWHEFAEQVLQEMGVPVTAVPLTSDRLWLAARRPLNGCLGSERIGQLRPWREALHDWANGVENP
ncbi:MAG TPA: dTDP-4-dehydrorhamnose reductase [Candidatus Dormibacteraeota bacterium]|nr:dTDP-4-dehydrorhamnose reductase [Candidatus Dormibacteraeota bacterium]